MKVPVYLMIGKTPKGPRIVAKMKPNYKPFDNGVSPKYSNPKYYPTIIIKLNLDIPDSEFFAAKRQLDIKIEESTPAIEIKQEDLK